MHVPKTTGKAKSPSSMLTISGESGFLKTSYILLQLKRILIKYFENRKLNSKLLLEENTGWGQKEQSMKSAETLDFGRGDTSQGKGHGSKVKAGLFPPQDAVRRQMSQELAFRFEEKQRNPRGMCKTRKTQNPAGPEDCSSSFSV